MKTKNTGKIYKLSFLAIMTALVIVLGFVGSTIRLGPFSISLVLLPIVIGVTVCGPYAGAWLGLIFGVIVLASGDANAFLAINPFATVVTVLAKGVLCGLAAGVVFTLLEKKNRYLAVFASAIVCPLVNTGIFLLGCRVFFMDTMCEWAGGTNVLVYMLTMLVGANFIVELLINVILSPTVVRLLDVPQLKEKIKK